MSRIAATRSKPKHQEDTDGNGIAEIAACFAREDLANLFNSIQGTQEVVVTIHGQLSNGSEFTSSLQLIVKGKHADSRRLAVRVSPNPMNPGGVLKLTTRTRGLVTVRLFNLSGRLVRTLAREETIDAGDHTFALDGRDDRGGLLASGVYFYQVESSEGKVKGRFAIAK